MDKDHKLLVIGAGIGQVPIIRKAKSRGVYTVVVTLPGNQPGIELADDVLYCDIYERDTIVGWARENGITAVVSDQNDLMNPTVAYVAEKLGIPGNTFKQVMAYCNKNEYRDNCDYLGIPVPKHVAVFSPDFDPSSFDCPLPWVVKPADSQSSVGVKRVDRVEELRGALVEAIGSSKTHGAILEEFFEGHEVVCEGFIRNGKYYLLSFADRKYFKLDNLMIPSQTLFPSTIDKALQDEIVSYETRMAKYISPSFAIVHSEYLVNLKTREVRVVESALRGGGVYISSDLIPLATGIDANDLLLDLVLGERADVDSITAMNKHAAAGYICFYLPQGKVVDVLGVDKVKSFPFVHRLDLDSVSIGSTTPPLTHKGQRLGPILVSGDNRIALERNIETIKKSLIVRVACPNGEVRDAIWE